MRHDEGKSAGRSQMALLSLLVAAARMSSSTVESFSIPKAHCATATRSFQISSSQGCSHLSAYIMEGSSSMGEESSPPSPTTLTGVVDQLDIEEPLLSVGEPSLLERILDTYWGPRIVLAVTACVYATNFPLGAIMNAAMPASATTSARMVIASVAMFPFLLQLDKKLCGPVLLGGSFVAMGYITQSLALVDTAPATVSFLGAAAVLVCPFLEWLVDGKARDPMSSPQTWMAACLCLLGVACLEVWDPASSETAAAAANHVLSGVGRGDVLALLQGVGFGTGIFMVEKMMKSHPTMAMSITAGMVSTTAFISMLWCFVDGWVWQPGGEAYFLPNLFLEPSMQPVAFAILWTGIASTSLNYALENTAIGRVPSSESSVILATEPMWAAVLASVVFHTQTLDLSDYIGGALLVGACLVNGLKPSDIRNILSTEEEIETRTTNATDA